MWIVVAALVGMVVGGGAVFGCAKLVFRGYSRMLWLVVRRLEESQGRLLLTVRKTSRSPGLDADAVTSLRAVARHEAGALTRVLEEVKRLPSARVLDDDWKSLLTREESES